eukprot:s2305_g7.t1
MPTLSTLKRPAAKPSLKRPASSINETISKLQRGVSKNDLKETPGPDGEDDEEGEATGRDKAKGQKSRKMKSELPEHVIDLRERQSQKASSPRLFKTQIINKLFRRTPSRRLEINLEDELFSEHRRVSQKRFSKEKETAYPESILRGLYFGNSQEALDRAKQAGEVDPLEHESGKAFCAFKSMTRGIENAKVEEQLPSSHKKIKSPGGCGSDLKPTKSNLDKLMQDMALHTTSYNELIETSRGLLRSKKN